jgi:GNAT superfamily N-acetyltransferase
VEVTARPAVEADLPTLAALVTDGIAATAGQRGAELWRLEWAPHPPLDASLQQRLHDRDAGTLVGGFDDHALGVLLLDRRQIVDGPAIARITFVFVEPEARHIGIGEAVIDAAAAWARAAGCTGLDGLALPGDRHIKNLYERSGMTARELTTFRELGP